MATRPSRIWITWERQRRSIEMAKRLGCELRLFESPSPYLLRAIQLGFRTLMTLARRPRVVFVQNPSIVLAAIVVFMRPLFRYLVVVDRHSNFKLHTAHSKHPQWLLFHALSRYTVRGADLTIVTNERLAGLVQRWGGRAFILPDPLPDLPHAIRRELAEQTVVCVSSFGSDEPIAEVLAAAAEVGGSVRIVITGNPAHLPESLRRSAPENVRFSGFLAEPDFQQLLASCDAIMALTTQPHTLLCAAYEAVALCQPLILSDQEELVAYFTRGCVPTQNDGASIARAVAVALARKDALIEESRLLKAELERSWSKQFAELQDRVASLSEGT